MRINQIITCLFISILGSLNTMGQDGDGTEVNRYLNFGIGTSSWGVPIYANLEFPLKSVDNVSLAFGGSFQTKSEKYRYLYYNATWRHTIIGLSSSGQYYFDELIGVPENFDVYAGVQIDYYIWRTTLRDSDDGFDQNYSGTGAGGVGASGLVGGRYHFGTSKRASLNVVLGGGTVLSSGRVGLSIKL